MRQAQSTCSKAVSMLLLPSGRSWKRGIPPRASWTSKGLSLRRCLSSICGGNPDSTRLSSGGRSSGGLRCGHSGSCRQFRGVCGVSAQHPASLRHLPGALRFTSVLTLPTQSRHLSPKVEGSVLQGRPHSRCFLPTGYRLGPSWALVNLREQPAHRTWRSILVTRLRVYCKRL